MKQPTPAQLERLARAINVTIIDDEPTVPDVERERLSRSGVLAADGSFEPFAAESSRGFRRGWGEHRRSQRHG